MNLKSSIIECVTLNGESSIAEICATVNNYPYNTIKSTVVKLAADGVFTVNKNNDKSVFLYSIPLNKILIRQKWDSTLEI